jgi:hypothetical protein
MLEVIQPGTKVLIGDGISATIEQAIINRGNHITYKVAWWAGRDIKTDIFYPDEVNPKEHGKRKQIGFKVEE